MRIGLQLPSFTWPGGAEKIRVHLAEIARAAEHAGFYSLWLMDHFFQIPWVGPAEDEMLEAYTALGFLAAHTQRIRLGTLVTGVTYRHPGILAKTATTLDVLSGGRAYLGIGAAWYEREHAGLGVPFPPLRERFEHLEDALRIAHQMWSGQAGPLEGRRHRLAETLNRPPALRRPHPPILIGGKGERCTLRLVAQYADAWNVFDYIGLDEMKRLRDVLRRHCDALGRDFDAIEKTSLGSIDLRKTSVRDALGHFRALRAAGFEHAIVSLPDVAGLESIATFGREIVPELG
jgi:F420-dependent oxidoreductase-like protein